MAALWQMTDSAALRRAVFYCRAPGLVTHQVTGPPRQWHFGEAEGLSMRSTGTAYGLFSGTSGILDIHDSQRNPARSKITDIHDMYRYPQKTESHGYL